FVKADVKRQGTDITVVAYGLMLHETLAAAEQVSREGLSVEVVDPRTLNPIDRETILNSVKKTGKALIVYEDNHSLGWGAEIAATLAEDAFEFLDAPVMRLTGPDVPGVPYARTEQDLFMPDAEKIAAALRKLGAY
ncbi:MAG TPA: transketolase C-terminal domain-containing protein, partial [Anaerolineae bacterium]